MWPGVTWPEARHWVGLSRCDDVQLGCVNCAASDGRGQQPAARQGQRTAPKRRGWLARVLQYRIG